MYKWKKPIFMWVLIVLLITQSFTPVFNVSAMEQTESEISSISEPISNQEENVDGNESVDHSQTEDGEIADSPINTGDEGNSEEDATPADESEETGENSTTPADESEENGEESAAPADESEKNEENGATPAVDAEENQGNGDIPAIESEENNENEGSPEGEIGENIENQDTPPTEKLEEGEKVQEEPLEEPPLEQPLGLMPIFHLMGAPQPITDNIITSVVMKDDENGNRIEEIRPEQGSRVWIELTWELPDGHGYGDGSTFAFNLPEKFKLGIPLDGDLTGDVGTYFVSPEGKVTFTFNDSIEDGTGLDGYFYVWREFAEDKFSGGLKQDIEFEHGETITVHFLPKNGTKEIEKLGELDKKMNPSKIDWVVDFNKHEKTITNAVFTDTLPTGLTIDEDSIEVYELEVQLDGTVIEEPLFTDYISLVNAEGFEIKFNHPIDKAYRVKYLTTVEPIHTAPYKATFKNAVTVSGNGDPNIMDDAYSVSVQFSKPLDKKSTNYDSETQTITWAIQYNYNEQAIVESNARIADEFTDNQELDGSSFEVYEMTIAEDGSASRKSDTPLEVDDDYTVTTSGNGFTLQFNEDINAAYEIIYKTTAKDRVYEDSIDVENTVQIHDGTEVTATRSIGQVIFWKSLVGINYAENTITWGISLNDDKQLMENVVITDDFTGQGLTFVPESVTITGLDEGDYTISPETSYDKGFKIEFNNPVTNSHWITYQTTYNPTEYSPDEIKSKSFTNTATLEWEEGGNPQAPITKTATATLNGDTKRNGVKTGSYNAITKEITWTIDVNYNRHVMNNAVFKDIYTGDQTFSPDSLKVNKLDITANGGKTLGDSHEIKEGDLTEIIEDGKTQGFTLKLGNIDSAYRITYKTSLETHPVVDLYSNKATLYSSDDNIEWFNESATVRPEHGGEYITKDGKQGTGADAEFAFWTVNINRSQSSIEAGATLTDTLSENQILDKDSVKLFATTVEVNGNLKKGAEVAESEYNVTVTENNQLTLTFNNAIDRSYILEYKSFINAGDGDEISNNVSFAGQSSGTVNENENKEVKVSFAGAGGGASANKGSIIINKVDADTKMPLAGATFGLYNKTGSTLLETMTTGEDGVADFKEYRYRDYMIKEVVAPNGYVISAEYEDGKEITIDDSLITITVENNEIKQGFVLTKLDKDDSTKTLEGAVFKLQKDVGGSIYEDIEELTTNKAGIIAKGELPPGSYQLVETRAPKGYKLDPTPIPVTIVANQTEIVKLESKNEVNVGSVELQKIDQFNPLIRLAGAEFVLQDADGNELQSDLITNQDGKILVENLKAGTYQFVEIVAPVDYELDSTPIEFEMIDEGTLPLLITNKLIPGSVKLTKVRQGNSTLKLAGAEFTLLDMNKQIVKDSNGQELRALTTNEKGELIVEQLNPGKYQFVETKAPVGHVLNSNPIEFEIVRNQQPGVHTEVIAENKRRSSSGGGSSSNEKPKEDPTSNEEDPEDPKNNEDDPTINEEEQPKDQTGNHDPENNHNNSTNSENQPDNESNQTTETEPSRETNDNNRNDDYSQESAASVHTTSPSEQTTKQLLPQTGETSSKLPWIGVFLCLIGIAFWSRLRWRS